MLKQKDREEILRIIKTEKDARVIYRANALNLRNKGLSAAEVADFLEITSRTVFNIQKNYEDGGLEKALYDDPRPGTPPRFDDRVKARIVAVVCSDPPEGFDRWTLELIQEHVIDENVVDSISRETIRVILQEHDLKPWQQKSWCVPDLDDEFIERMEDVLAVYERNYRPAYPVVCIDEKPIQLLEDTRPPSGIAPGEIKKVDFEYKRKGTANVFCAVEPLQGIYVNKVTETRTGAEFAKFLASIERKYPDAKKIILVMDNLNTHREKSLIDFYGEEQGRAIWSRFEVHYTPIHGSWLNQAEIAINMYSRQSLGRTRIPDLESLKKRTKAWVNYINAKKVIINWQFTQADAREKFDYV
jgi:transposase